MLCIRTLRVLVSVRYWNRGYFLLLTKKGKFQGLNGQLLGWVLLDPHLETYLERSSIPTVFWSDISDAVCDLLIVSRVEEGWWLMVGDLFIPVVDLPSGLSGSLEECKICLRLRTTGSLPTPCRVFRRQSAELVADRMDIVVVRLCRERLDRESLSQLEQFQFDCDGRSRLAVPN